MAWSAAQAVHLQVPISAMVFTVVVTTIGMLLPSTPGYIGVFHYLVTVALAPFGVPKEQALTFALVWHGVNYLTLSLSGVDRALGARHIARAGAGAGAAVAHSRVWGAMGGDAGVAGQEQG